MTQDVKTLLTPKILCIDGMNLACRAGTSKFALGDDFVSFNFLRSLKSLVELHSPTRVYIALEGKDKKNHALHSEYKANRKEGKEEFYAQVNRLFKFIGELLPVSIVRHPDYEADDTIANIALNSTSTIPWTIVSSDTDFIQLIQDRPNLNIYNPVKKQYVIAPTDYSYVVWKSLSGDSSDNIPGLTGVGNVTATKLAKDPIALETFLKKRPQEDREKFERNLKLIKFWRWTDDDAMNMTSSMPTKDWDKVKAKFEEWKFESMLAEKYWKKFVAALDPLWTGPLWAIE